MMINEQKIIEFQNVTKKFRIIKEQKDSIFDLVRLFFKKNKHDTITVLDNISFNVQQGEMLGILGLNGSGKTTLLKIISKIIPPDSGNVTTKGNIIPFLALGAGFNGELTAYDNIILYGVILGFSKKEIKKRVQKIIKFAELEDFLYVKLKNFSSGMYTRLAFSTAVEVNPDILLIDEMLSVGDIGFRKKSFETFMKFKSNGKTIVYVTHDLEQINQFCDKALWLDKGKIKMYGEPLEITKEYKNQNTPLR